MTDVALTPIPEALLAGLNDDQRDAVETLHGPLLIIAGPGSGKTRVLTHRIAALIATGAATPDQILAVTFTNRAASEMRERVVALVGPEAWSMWVSTFHSACVKILRTNASLVGLPTSFSIVDAGDSRSLISKVLAEANPNAPVEKDLIKEAQMRISLAKNADQSPEDIAEYSEHGWVAPVMTAYNRRLREMGAVDFDDILLHCLALLRDNPEVTERWRARFRHVLVDEFQDTNTVQYRILRYLTIGADSYCVVGDPDQCLLPGTLIDTPHGPVAIENLVAGDEVLTTRGQFNQVTSIVREASQRVYDGQVFKVTAGPATLTGTPHHLVPARFEAQDGSYTYLMETASGYRVGAASFAGAHRVSGLEKSFAEQLSEHQGQKLWVLSTYATRDQAEEDANEFYAYLLEESSVWPEALAQGLLLHPEFPHAVILNDPSRAPVKLTMFASTRPSHVRHEVTWSGTDPDARARVYSAGYEPRQSKNRPDVTRVEVACSDYRDALGDALELGALTGAPLQRSMQIGGRVYLMTPLSHLHVGMKALVSADDGFDVAAVTSVQRSAYAGAVYDLEVAGDHNYVAGGLLVHNSIYGFRGATPQVVEAFQADEHDTKIVVLNENYRSTPAILRTVQSIIDANPSPKRAHLTTSKDEGAPVRLVVAQSNRDEARFVITEIKNRLAKDPTSGQYAILVRTNFQTRSFEEELTKSAMRYQILGALRFYDRAEIKDALSYLRTAINPTDKISLARCLNTPRRGIGKVTGELVIASANPIDAIRATVHPGSVAGVEALTVPKAALASLGRFLSVIDTVTQACASSPSNALRVVANHAGLRQSLADMKVGGEERVDNLDELIRSADDFAKAFNERDPRTMSTVSEIDGVEGGLAVTLAYLENVALISANDDDTEAADTVLLSAHASKGNFPHTRSLGATGIQEERRLLFVAASRAELSLTLTRCSERWMFGETKSVHRSRFLADLPDDVEEFEVDDLLPKFYQPQRQFANAYKPQKKEWPKKPYDEPPRALRAGEFPARQSTAPGPLRTSLLAPRTGAATVPAQRLSIAQLSVGRRVEHAKYGVGVVHALRSAENVAVITFDDGRKDMNLNFAPLTLVD